MGVETEYAATGFAADNPENGSGVFSDLYGVICERVPWLTDTSTAGAYLANGARFYHDSGHPEYATPECASPRELLTSIRAGEQLLAEAAASISRWQGREVAVFRNNVDYGGMRSTWGCHESYLHRVAPQALPDQLIPHFVSRVVFTGAGGFVPDSEGIEFTISPRARMLEYATSGSSTGTRGIFHTKDETLAGEGYHRLHVICGESLCTSLGTLLKVGTTALIVAAIDSGWNMDDGLALKSPIDALRAIVKDPECRRIVTLANGNRVTAVDLQRQYLRKVEECRQYGRLPEWAGEICALWSDALDHIGRNDGWVERSLDWGIKQALFRQWVGGSDRWEALRSQNRTWRYARTQLWRAMQTLPEPGNLSIHNVMFGADCPIPDEKARISRYLAEKGTDWEGIRRFLALRQELFEIDVRYSQLGERGIHTQLSAQGLTGDPLTTEQEVTRAMMHPPEGGRAMARGQLIRELWRGKAMVDIGCNWTRVWDRRGRRFVDLSDPFGTEVRWEPQAQVDARMAMLEDLRGACTGFF